jgi:hypothetical protein
MVGPSLTDAPVRLAGWATDRAFLASAVRASEAAISVDNINVGGFSNDAKSGAPCGGPPETRREPSPLREPL